MLHQVAADARAGAAEARFAVNRNRARRRLARRDEAVQDALRRIAAVEVVQLEEVHARVGHLAVVVILLVQADLRDGGGGR